MSKQAVTFLRVGFITFLLSLGLGFVSKSALGRVGLILGLLILLGIILIGIVFDIIGTAATAADERPFNAMAAKKVYGARQGLRIVRNAHKVANFCNDIVGDICGTVSGAIGASMVFRLIQAYPGLREAFISVVLTGLIAALTVGGKAYSKAFAIKEAERIVLAAGEVLGWLEDVLRIRLLVGSTNSKKFSSRSNNRKAAGKKGETGRRVK